MQNHTSRSLRTLVIACAAALIAVASLSACTTARKVGQGSKQVVKDGVEAVKEGGREVKRAIKEN